MLDSPLRRRRTFSTNEAIVKDFGKKLFDFALSGEVLAQLRACQRAAKSQQQAGVRLRLRILDPELAGLPWEYLYDAQLRDFIALDPNMPLVRYLYHSYAAVPLSVMPPLRILAMVAAPINLQKLDIEREKQHVEQAVAALQRSGRIELIWIEGEGALDLQSALRKGPWHIFHFIGHGDFDLLRDEGYLVLCNPGSKQAEPLYATQLARLLSAQNHNLRFVLLNACESARGSKNDIFSSTAATLINRDIPAVLAMQYSITDDAATIFAQKLYASIAEGLPIDRSVAEARNALSLADSQNLEWGVPVLHMRSPDGNFFNIAQLSAVPAQTLQNELPKADEQKHEKSEPKGIAVTPSIAQAPPVESPTSGEAKRDVQVEPVKLEEPKTPPTVQSEVVKETPPVAQTSQPATAPASKEAQSVQVELPKNKKPAQKDRTPSTATTAERPPIEFDWVVIPAGEFLMGSDKQKDLNARDDELPQHRVTLSEYAIARVPVTNAQYD